MVQSIQKTKQYKIGNKVTDQIILTLEHNGFDVKKLSEDIDQEFAIDILTYHENHGVFNIDCKKVMSSSFYDAFFFFIKFEKINGKYTMISKGPWKYEAETTHLALLLDNSKQIKIVPFDEFIFLNFLNKEMFRQHRKIFSFLTKHDRKTWEEIIPFLHKKINTTKDPFDQFLIIFKEYFVRSFLDNEKYEKGDNKQINLNYGFYDRENPTDISFVLQLKDKNKIIYPKKTLTFDLIKEKIVVNQDQKIDTDVQVNL